MGSVECKCGARWSLIGWQHQCDLVASTEKRLYREYVKSGHTAALHDRSMRDEIPKATCEIRRCPKCNTNNRVVFKDGNVLEK
jgi:hypothetical protein